MGTITPTMRVKQIKLDYKPNTMRVKKFSKSVSSIQFKIELFRFPSNWVLTELKFWLMIQFCSANKIYTFVPWMITYYIIIFDIRKEKKSSRKKFFMHESTWLYQWFFGILLMTKTAQSPVNISTTGSSQMLHWLLVLKTKHGWPDSSEWNVAQNQKTKDCRRRAV